MLYTAAMVIYRSGPRTRTGSAASSPPPLRMAGDLQLCIVCILDAGPPRGAPERAKEGVAQRRAAAGLWRRGLRKALVCEVGKGVAVRTHARLCQNHAYAQCQTLTCIIT